jgi:VacB/RNase II family 3'-5' exoribonuclease
VSPRVTVRPVEAPPFRDAFAHIRDVFEIPTAFPEAVEADAATAARRGPVLPPGSSAAPRRDARDIAFVTIDPSGSRDLDQAFHAERRPDGFRVHYAIADVAAFVAPGGAMDDESFARGVTLYLPDGRAPLLPAVVGEGCASLLPDRDRATLLWTIDLDDAGRTTSVRLERATVRSRAALAYTTVQDALDSGRADESLALLHTIGSLRLEQQVERGGVNLDLPAQEVVAAANGFALRYDTPLPIETWNAQISLLAGMEAAAIMVEAGEGIVRTLPPPEQAQLDRLRRVADALGVSWSDGARWSDVVRRLDRTRPGNEAFLIQAAHILRGAGYAKLDASNTRDPATVPTHAGVGAPYAHVTAPLRRLADRYANEIVLAACGGIEPPAWAMEALDRLVETMRAASRLDADVDRAVIDTVECAVLAGHVGERFDAVVIDKTKRGVTVQLSRAAVVAHMDADLELGQRLSVVLTAIDPVARRIDLAPSGRS